MTYLWFVANGALNLEDLVRQRDEARRLSDPHLAARYRDLEAGYDRRNREAAEWQMRAEVAERRVQQQTEELAVAWNRCGELDSMVATLRALLSHVVDYVHDMGGVGARELESAAQAAILATDPDSGRDQPRDDGDHK